MRTVVPIMLDCKRTLQIETCFIKFSNYLEKVLDINRKINAM